MLISDMATRVNCTVSNLRRLVKAGHLKAEEARSKQFNHKTLNIKMTVPEVKAIVLEKTPRAGYKRNKNNSSLENSNLLRDFLTWKSIPLNKRGILINLSKYSIKELQILVELVK